MKKVNKNDLVDIIAEQGHLSKKDSKIAVDLFLELIEQNLIEGHEINLSNFGTFKVKEYKSRCGTHPQKHTPLEIKARKSVVFHQSSHLKSVIEDE